MASSNHLKAITQLAESEGVFTTAQAERMAVPRDALHDAFASGRVERIMRGAYRLVGSGASFTDELVAAWKLTSPAQFTHERIRVSDWDGVTVGGATASALHEIGNLHLSPYRIYAPRRINSRNTATSFAKRTVSRSDVMFSHGVLVTRLERTVFDLIVDNEDLSLVADTLRDAWWLYRDFDFDRLAGLLRGQYNREKAQKLYTDLLADSGLAETAGVQ